MGLGLLMNFRHDTHPDKPAIAAEAEGSQQEVRLRLGAFTRLEGTR